MKDVTDYPLSPTQRKEVEEYMTKHNVTENEARHKLGYVPCVSSKVSVTKALNMIQEENPNVELTKETLKFYLNEVMKKCIPKPNPALVMGILIRNLKPIVCPDCGYEIEVYGFNPPVTVELIDTKKSAIVCPMCGTPIEK